MSLSVIIIAQDEAANIGECLDSVAFADERIVVDGGSRDDTVAIAEGKGARVVMHPFAGFGAQKNFALSQAQGDWVLSVDADERVSQTLAAEIERAIRLCDADAYEFPRLSTFCGQTIRHSGWYPDFVLRLFRRDRARFTNDNVHERILCEGRVRRLKQPLDHHPVTYIDQALRRITQYSEFGSETITGSGKRVSFFSGIAHGFWTFVRMYLIRAGFLDGRMGFLIAVATAEGSYYKYMKAWLAGRKAE